MMDPRDMPTAADFAFANSMQALRTAEAAEKKKISMEEEITVLKGQVSFLAEMIGNIINGHGWYKENDLKTLVKIQEWGKE